MSSYEEIKAAYLSGDLAATSLLAESCRVPLSQDGAGCTLMAAVLTSLGRSDEALAWAEAATRLEPQSARAWRNLGTLLKQIGRFDAALQGMREAVELEPESADNWLDCGETAILAGALPDALSCLDRTLDLDPRRAPALAARGIVLYRLHRKGEALRSYDAALALQPDDARTWLNRGVLLQEDGRTADAIASYDTSLVLDPRCVEAWTNRAKALQHLHRIPEAVASFERALAERPSDPVLLKDYALLLLLAGDYERGFAQYEARLRIGQPATLGTWPVWQGEDLRERRILVLAEQGHGDTFQFVRYLPALAATGARVTLMVPPALLRVLTGLNQACEIVAAISRDERFDYQVALLSLPHLLGNGLGEPAGAPYLAARPDAVESWKDLIGEEGFRIGIAWQGNPNYEQDGARSIQLSNFLRLDEIPGVRLISLQKIDGLEQLADIVVERHPELLPDTVDRDGAFVDTAAILSSLDLVVCSDSALAHLAGALGRPVWLALAHVPDWRWLLHGEDCPWYPTMTLFRQEREGDWDGVFARIEGALRRHIDRHAPPLPTIPCSFGELVDKITILEIKSQRMHDVRQSRFVRQELRELRKTLEPYLSEEVGEIAKRLKVVNELLWDAEDALRSCERMQTFDGGFIELSRSVYIRNDERSALKSMLNRITGSRLAEQKSYAATPDSSTTE